jgi:hypothetical protein
MIGKPALDPVPALMIDDRGMKAFVDLVLVGQPTDVNRVRQDLVEMPPADQAAARDLAPAIGSAGESVLRRTFKVSRPMLVVVLNDWVTETKDTRCSSKSSTAWRGRQVIGSTGRPCRQR